MPERITVSIAQLGMTAMIIATVAAAGEAATHEGQRMLAALQLQSSYATAIQSTQASDPELRRSGSKEEIHNASATYGAVKRSASVAGTA